jgi:hypothetical protein
MLSVAINLLLCCCHYTECHCTECCYAECHAPSIQLETTCTLDAIEKNLKTAPLQSG